MDGSLYSISAGAAAVAAQGNPETFRNYREERKYRQVLFRQSPRKTDKKNNPTGVSHTLRYQTIPMCGHAFVPGHEPRFRNCESCWFTFFNTHGELTQACDEVFQKFGELGLRQLRGPKFTWNYLAFMSTVAQWKQAAEAAKSTQENHAQDSTSAVGGVSGHAGYDGIVEVSEDAGADSL